MSRSMVAMTPSRSWSPAMPSGVSGPLIRTRAAVSLQYLPDPPLGRAKQGDDDVAAGHLTDREAHRAVTATMIIRPATGSAWPPESTAASPRRSCSGRTGSDAVLGTGQSPGGIGPDWLWRLRSPHARAARVAAQPAVPPICPHHRCSPSDVRTSRAFGHR